MVALVNIHRVPNPDKEHFQLPQVFSVQIPSIVHFLIPDVVREPPRSGRAKFKFVIDWEWVGI